MVFNLVKVAVGALIAIHQILFGNDWKGCRLLRSISPFSKHF